MKSLLVSLWVLPLLASASADAGINGKYSISGNENDNGARYTFRGTLTISQFKKGNYNLVFNDGDRSTFGFTFRTPLRETKARQTVSFSSPLGTGAATFRFLNGKYKVIFNYKSKDGSVAGSGTGLK